MDQELGKRVRKAARKWPVTELDSIEREAFVNAVFEAQSFDELEPAWQRVILEAEAGSRRLDAKQFFLHLRSSSRSFRSAR